MFKNKYFLLHFAVLLAGFTGVLGKLISLNEIPLVWYRVLFSAVILFIIVFISKINAAANFKTIKRISFPGLIITAHWIFFYASIKYSNISIGVVCYCLTSFFTAVFEPLVNKTKFKPVQLLLSAVTLLGISLIFHFDTAYQLGIMLGVISSAFAALYTIYNEKLVQHYDSKLINFYQMLSGTVALGILLPVYYYLYPDAAFIPAVSDAVYLFLLAAVCTVGLYIIFAEVLKKLPAFTVNLSFNLEPVYAIIIAFIFFNEGKEVNASFYIGVALVILSVVFQSVISKKKTV